MTKLKTRRISSLTHERIRAGLVAADRLLEQGEVHKARRSLEALLMRHPNDIDILESLVDLSLDSDDIASYHLYMEQLAEVQPHRAELHLAKGGSAMTLLLPFTAMAAFRTFLSRWPDHSEVQGVNERMALLERGRNQWLADVGGTSLEDEGVALRHERVRLLLSAQRTSEAIPLASALVSERPDILSPYNNLALALWAEGDLQGAINASQQALKRAPDNVHALANLTRFLVVSGDAEGARSIAQRLEQSKAQAADRGMKLCEAFSFLGDDMKVLQSFERSAKEVGSMLPSFQSLMWHWAAASAARLGDNNAARKHWARALAISPSNEAVRSLLESLDAAPEARELPWHHSVIKWISPSRLSALLSLFQSTKSSEPASPEAFGRRLFELFPELLTLVPIWFDRGDPLAVRLALQSCEASAPPLLMNAAKRFATGGRGTWKDRRRAATLVCEAGLLDAVPEELRFADEGGSFIKLEFEVHNEPEMRHPRQVEGLASQAFDLLQSRQSRKAEKLLQKAIALQPNAPDLLNNLANALALQGREQEALVMLEEIHRRFPDYPFARIQLARHALRRDDAAKAEELIAPLLRSRRIHATEMSALCSIKTELEVHNGRLDAARIWLQMLESGCPTDRQIPRLKVLVEMQNTVARFRSVS
ncbi:MAG: tetratricopeptide repeat protein [Myxococcaceae bacterium]